MKSTELKARCFEVLWKELITIVCTSGKIDPDCIVEMSKKFRTEADTLGICSDETLAIFGPELRRLCNHTDKCDMEKDWQDRCYNESTRQGILLDYLLAKELGWVIAGFRKFEEVADNVVARLLRLKKTEVRELNKAAFVRGFLLLPKREQERLVPGLSREIKKLKKQKS